MQRFAKIPLTATLALMLAAPGFAQATGSSAQAAGAGAPPPVKIVGDKAPAPTQASPTTPQATPPASPSVPPTEPPSPSLQSQLDANNTQLQRQKKLEVIKVKGGMVAAATREKADKKLGAVSKKTDADAAAQGEATVAARLAAEFGMSAEDLATEREALGCPWGELMIARSLRAMSLTEVSAPQLVELRKDIGWAQIAAGLGLKLGEAVDAVRSEERVAAGLVEPDGKVAAIPEAPRKHTSKKSHTAASAAGAQTAAQAAKVKP